MSDTEHAMEVRDMESDETLTYIQYRADYLAAKIREQFPNAKIEQSSLSDGSDLAFEVERIIDWAQLALMLRNKPTDPHIVDVG